MFSLKQQQQQREIKHISVSLSEARDYIQHTFDSEEEPNHQNVSMILQRFPQLIDEECPGLLVTVLYKKSPLHVLQLIAKRCPESLQAVDEEFGWNPLHHACLIGSDQSIIRLLVEAYPAALKKVGLMEGTPLHIACQALHSDVVKVLVECDPTALLIPNKEGLLPIEQVFVLMDDSDVFDYTTYHSILDTLTSRPSSVDGGTLLGKVKDGRNSAQDVENCFARLDLSEYSLSTKSIETAFRLAREKGMKELCVATADPITVVLDRMIRDLLSDNQSLSHLSVQLGGGCSYFHSNNNNSSDSSSSMNKSHEAIQLTSLGDSLVEGLKQNNNLRSISIGCRTKYTLHPSVVRMFLNKLESIKISGMLYVGGVVGDYLTTSTSRVRSLTIQDCNLSICDLRKLASKLGGGSSSSDSYCCIQELSITEDSFTNQEVMELQPFASQFGCLDRLMVRFSNVHSSVLLDNFVLELLNCKPSSSSSLRSLKLRCSGWTDACIAKLAKGLQLETTQRLEHLSVGTMDSKASVDLAPLVDTMKNHNNTTLKSFELMSWDGSTNPLEEEVQYYCTLNAAGRRDIRQNSMTSDQMVSKLSGHSVSVTFGLLRDDPHSWAS